jgi:hypothetical protein
LEKRLDEHVTALLAMCGPAERIWMGVSWRVRAAAPGQGPTRAAGLQLVAQSYKQTANLHTPGVRYVG